MAVKNISDLQVVQAYVYARVSGVWPYDVLAERTGEPPKVCYRAMERAHKRELIDYGVSLRSGWLTDKGKKLLEGKYDGLEIKAVIYDEFKDKK